jgi:hypothetical protein
VLVLSGHALKDPSARIRAKPTLRVEANADPHDLARRVLADESQEVEV